MPCIGIRWSKRVWFRLVNTPVDTYKKEVLVRANSIFSFDVTNTTYKTTPPAISRGYGNVLTELLPSNYSRIHSPVQSSPVDCCWSSPAQWFLVASPTGLMTIFYCLTALGAFRPPLQRYIYWNSGYIDKATDSPLIQYGPYRKWQFQQLFYCCVCISCRGNLEPLHSNDRGDKHTDTQIDGRDLWSTPLRWAQAAGYT
jgi:hypothetical protein